MVRVNSAEEAASVCEKQIVSSSSRLVRRSSLSKGGKMAVTLSSSDTVGIVKMKLYERCDIFPGQQTLYLNGVATTCDDLSLAQLGMKRNCCVALEVDESADCNFPAQVLGTSGGGDELGFTGSVLVSNPHSYKETESINSVGGQEVCKATALEEVAIESQPSSAMGAVELEDSVEKARPMEDIEDVDLEQSPEPIDLDDD